MLISNNFLHQLFFFITSILVYDEMVWSVQHFSKSLRGMVSW